jgi:catechol 2,3-dioxygenase-like lactoylglutathione lyase family enzyme
MSPPTNAVRQLRLVVEVSDLDDAVSFYRDALGLREQARHRVRGARRGSAMTVDVLVTPRAS